MTNAKHKFVVLRRGVDSREPIQAGDEVVTYELDQPFPFSDLPRHTGHDDDLRRYIEEVNDEIRSDLDPDLIWREEGAIYCAECPKRGAGRKLVSIMIHVRTARRWVSPRAERTPSGFEDVEAEAWPIHGQPDEMPCPSGVVSCPGCRKRWLIVSNLGAVTLLGITTVRYGAEVQPG